MQARLSNNRLALLCIGLLLLIAIIFANYRRNHYLDYDLVWSSRPNPVTPFPTDFSAKLKFALQRTRPRFVARVIHQSWKTTKLPSDRMKRWSASWRNCFPGWIYLLWTDEENRALVAEYYPWFLKKYDALPENIMRVDSVRYLYMHQFGGIYADLDTECLRPFEKLLNSTIVLGAMDGQWVTKMPVGLVQNSVMYSQPGHPFWIELVEHVFSLKSYGGVEETTGPLMLMKKLKAYLARGRTDVMIYPGRFFNPFSWLNNKNPNCDIMGQMTDEKLRKCRASFVGKSYVVQYHTKTWGGGQP